jgi:hypothetical protein
LNPDDDTALRLPDVSVLNFKLQASLEPLIKQKISLWVDLLNALALRTPLSVVEQDGPFWGATQTRMAASRLRVGARYQF